MLKKHVLLGLGGLALAAGAAWLGLGSKPDCPGDGHGCAGVLKAESPREKLREVALYHDFRRGQLAPGALRAAVERKKTLEFAKAEIAGADGPWREYGRGSLIASGLVQELGIVAVPDTNILLFAGRVDDFAYDSAAKRLFAAVGTGGIWMSEAVDGDVRTIGDLWVPVGEKLPYLATGGVMWTPAGGGTLVAVTGDSIMSTGGYLGLGAFWSTDQGQSWHQAPGFPDEAAVFNTAVDPGNHNILYIASSRGLFRSDDAGRSFKNVRLPTTPECAGNEDRASPCVFANMVSDVVVKAPGGTTDFECSHQGCPVLAAVGWRAGRLKFPGTDIPQAPANGLYRSATGEPGTFARLEPAPLDSTTEQGFTPAERVGRIEMGVASGPEQDHGYVYAMVQDAEALNGGGALTLDPPLDALGETPLTTYLSGVFVSPDFGETWTRMAPPEELAPASAFGALVTPGVQSWYNQWILPDPTRQVPALGIPTRLVFGLEEIFQSRTPHVPLNGTAQAGPADFEVIGRYFSVAGADQTTHADQHVGIFIPTDDGGVCVFGGNDGGVARQCALPGQEFDNLKWGRGANRGFYTLLDYGLGVARDGTVWFGLQDNGSGHIEPDTRLSYADFGGDGIFAEVDPDNSDIAYTETPDGGLVRTNDRGATSTDIAPPYTRPNFSNWFSLDTTDGKHMVTTANEIYETLDAPNVTGSSWKRVFSLGKNPKTKVLRTATVADVHGDAIYAGYCGDCGVTVNDTGFQNGLATNVGGKKPPRKGTGDGWHHATAAGLPNRLIMGIEIDPSNPAAVYVGLGGYMSGLRGPGVFGDANADIGRGNLFKSTDAGASFTDITGSLPDVPVNTVLRRGQQLLVGTDLGVFISSDLDGTSWAPLGSGLPAVPVTMLKLRPGNPNELFASTFGRHVWHYAFTGDAEIKAAPEAATPKAEGGGLFLGAFAPALLIGLGAACWLRRRSSL